MANYQAFELDIDMDQFGILIGGTIQGEVETVWSEETEWAPSSSDSEVVSISGDLQYTVLSDKREGTIDVNQIHGFLLDLVWEQVEEQFECSPQLVESCTR